MATDKENWLYVARALALTAEERAEAAKKIRADPKGWAATLEYLREEIERSQRVYRAAGAEVTDALRHARRRVKEPAAETKAAAEVAQERERIRRELSKDRAALRALKASTTRG